MLGAIYAGLYDIQGTFQLSLSCLTGNCTWPSSYSSLGVCNICKDTTKYMTKTCAVHLINLTDFSGTISVPYCNYTLPNGHNISGVTNDDTGQLPIFAASNTVEKSITIPQMKFPLSVISMISAQWVTKTTSGQIVDQFDGPYWQEMISANATECGLYACVKRYRVWTVRLCETLRLRCSERYLCRGCLINISEQLGRNDRRWFSAIYDVLRQTTEVLHKHLITAPILPQRVCRPRHEVDAEWLVARHRQREHRQWQHTKQHQQRSHGVPTIPQLQAGEQDFRQPCTKYDEPHTNGSRRSRGGSRKSPSHHRVCGLALARPPSNAHGSHFDLLARSDT